MKYGKIIILSLFLACGSMLWAQKESETNNDFIPKAGDWGFSINANPLTKYLGQLCNGTIGNTITEVGGQPYLHDDLSAPWKTISPILSVSGKYMLTDNFAFRVNMGWIHQRTNDKRYIQDDEARALDPLSEADVIDGRLVTNSGGSFSVAGEYRVGSRRVQGIFGGGVLYAFNYTRTRYNYGNAITELNNDPSVAFSEAKVAPTKSGFSSMRYLNNFTDGADHHAGLVAFVGIEWFFVKNISLGAEVNVAAVWAFNRPQYYVAEGFSTISSQREKWTELAAPASSGFIFGTGNVGANITLNFYFNEK